MSKKVMFAISIFVILITMNISAYSLVAFSPETKKQPPFKILGGNPYASDALYFRYPAKSLYIGGHFYYPQAKNPNFESYVYGERR